MNEASECQSDNLFYDLNEQLRSISVRRNYMMVSHKVTHIRKQLCNCR